MNKYISSINDAYYTSYREYHNREYWEQEQWDRIKKAEKQASDYIEKLEKMLEEINLKLNNDDTDEVRDDISKIIKDFKK